MSRKDSDDAVTLLRERFTVRHLSRLRRLVAEVAGRVGLPSRRGEDLALAVNEAAANAVKHAGGSGELELIQDDQRALVAEISDNGPGLTGQPIGALPARDATSGRGVYLMQQTCDRVEYRTGTTGTTVSLEMNLDGP